MGESLSGDVASRPSRLRVVDRDETDTEVPYRYGSETRRYLPDFIGLVDDGHGGDDLLHNTYWVPAVNNRRTLGRWAFAELTEIYQTDADVQAKVEGAFNEMIERAGGARAAVSA